MFIHSNIGDVQFHFATPVMQTVWPEAATYKDVMKRRILEKVGEDTGMQVSNMGGWHSTDDFLKWGGEDIHAFSQWIVQCIFNLYNSYHGGHFQELLNSSGTQVKFRINAWVNVNGQGNANALHNHAGSHWSGCYYLETPEDCGNFAILDPRMGVNMLDTRNALLDIFSGTMQKVQPREGLTVIFPSWLYHWVEPNLSSEDRISIAFNVFMMPEKVST